MQQILRLIAFAALAGFMLGQITILNVTPVAQGQGLALAALWVLAAFFSFLSVWLVTVGTTDAVLSLTDKDWQRWAAIGVLSFVWLATAVVVKLLLPIYLVAQAS